MNKLTAVAPIKLAEGHKTDSGALLELLLRSIERFCEPGMFETIVFVCPSSDMEFLRERARAWPRLPISVLDERALFEGVALYKTTPGWAIQQLVKMAACRFIETDFYLTLDADCFCIRGACFSDFVRDGRGLIQLESKRYHPGWWKESARILGSRADLEKPGMSVTPAIMSTTAMSGLLKELGARHGDWLRQLQTYYRPGHLNTLKQSILSAVWTEYTLYYSFLEKHDSVRDFHFDGASAACPGGRRTMVSGNSVWRLENFQSWDPACVFEGQDPAFFAVIQSNLRLSADEVRGKLSRYL